MHLADTKTLRKEKMEGCGDSKKTLRSSSRDAEEGNANGKNDNTCNNPVRTVSSSVHSEAGNVEKMHPWLVQELNIKYDDDAETTCAKKFKWQKVNKWKTISVAFEIKKDRKNGKPG